MKTMLLILCAVCAGAGPATKPDELVALRAQVAELRRENAALKQQLAKLMRAAPSDLERYIRDNKVDPAMADRMRRFAPAVGMGERDLDCMIAFQNALAKNVIASKETLAETDGTRAVRYTFFRMSGEGPRQQNYVVAFDGDGIVTRVENRGPVFNPPDHQPSVNDAMITYLQKLGPDPNP